MNTQQNTNNPQAELKPEQRNNPYQFWLFVALSLLFIITFVYYLPLRFQSEGTEGTMEHDDGMITEDHAHNGSESGGDHHNGLPTADEINKLPLRTPANRVEKLSYIENGEFKEFRLEASEFRWEMQPSTNVHVWGYNGQIPGPEIRVNEGDKVRVIVKNSLPDSTSVHWHGIDVPWQADGVPGVTQDAIKPGEEFIYEFTADPAGTHFYHTHGKNHTTSAQQLDMGLSGALIVEPATSAYSYDKEATLMLDEWNVMAGGVNSAISHVHGAFAEGAVPEFNTFTINGRVFPDTETISVQQGETYLIRFINAGSSAFHPMHFHGHNFQVVALDGNPIPPASVETRSTITVHPGETADILITANNPGPWLLHCHHVHHASAGMITLFEYQEF